MPEFSFARWTAPAVLAAALASLTGTATAATQSVDYGNLTASATVLTPLDFGDNLFVDTFTTEHGALNQTTTFTLASAVDVSGLAGWIVDSAAGQGPRLVGVNIDILDGSNTVVLSDTFTGVLGGFAHSSFLGSLGPGTYTLSATGNAVRDASLDISLSFAQPIPEPSAYAMLLGGLGLLGAMARRRS